MPREISGRTEESGDSSERAVNSGPTPEWELPEELVQELKPWIDVRLLGPSAFHLWLHRILILLPNPEGTPPAATDLESRITELAQALVVCAGSEAAAHFQAMECYQDNILLARRVKALEAMLRTFGSHPTEAAPDVERTVEQYMPRDRKP